MQYYFEINERGHSVCCKLYYQELCSIKRVVLFVHGFGGHKDNGAAEKFAERLLSKYENMAMVIFDLPGHGDDVKQKLCLEDCSIYLELVISYVQQKFQTEDIYSCATSFGGYLILKYIAEKGNPFRKIALRCPAVNMCDVLTKAIMTPENCVQLQTGKEIPVGFDRKIMMGISFLEELHKNDVQYWDFLDYAEDILIIHGKEDEIVPFEAARTFADNNQIKFICVEGADHRFQDFKKMDQAIEDILKFYLL